MQVSTRHRQVEYRCNTLAVFLYRSCLVAFVRSRDIAGGAAQSANMPRLIAGIGACVFRELWGLGAGFDLRSVMCRANRVQASMHSPGLLVTSGTALISA